MIELSLHNHKREQQNRDRQQKVMDLLTHSHEAIIVTDEKGWIQFMNPLAIELSGINDADRARHPISQLLHWYLPSDTVPTDILKTRVNEHLLLKQHPTAQEKPPLPIKVSASKLHHANKKISGYILSFFAIEKSEIRPESEQEKLLAMCASCKKIRTEHGSYINIELFLREKYGFRFSHGICPGCFECLYPEYFTDAH